MSTEMATRKRLVILTDTDELRKALRLEAAKQGKEMSELAEEILRNGLAEALGEVRRRDASKKKSGH